MHSVGVGVVTNRAGDKGLDAQYTCEVQGAQGMIHQAHTTSKKQDFGCAVHAKYGAKGEPGQASSIVHQAHLQFAQHLHCPGLPVMWLQLEHP